MANQGYPALPLNDSTQPQNTGYPSYNPNFPQQGYVPPGHQGYVPPGQQGYVPPGQQGYAQPQHGYAQPPPHSQGQPMASGYAQFPQGGYVPPGYVPPQPAPVVQQPGSHGGPPAAGAGGWTNIPQGPMNCQPSLECLTTIDKLLVRQKVEFMEVLTGFETNNKFKIKNDRNEEIYYAVEENDCLTRNCCGSMRPFDMKIYNRIQDQLVMNLHRPLACRSCCFPCCLQTMEVSAPPGNVIGSIEQEWTILSPLFSVKNASGEVMLRITGPMCRFSMGGDVDFDIISTEGENIGKISKQWSGLLREVFTDADYFGVMFPAELDVKMKAVLLGATFLIDAMFFEKWNNQETDRPGML